MSSPDTYRAGITWLRVCLADPLDSLGCGVGRDQQCVTMCSIDVRLIGCTPLNAQHPTDRWKDGLILIAVKNPDPAKSFNFSASSSGSGRHRTPATISAKSLRDWSAAKRHEPIPPNGSDRELYVIGVRCCLGSANNVIKAIPRVRFCWVGFFHESRQGI